MRSDELLTQLDVSISTARERIARQNAIIAKLREDRHSAQVVARAEQLLASLETALLTLVEMRRTMPHTDLRNPPSGIGQ